MRKWIGLLALVVFVCGCMYPMGVNQTREQTRSREAEAWLKSLMESRGRYKGAPTQPLTVQGDNNVIVPPATKPVDEEAEDKVRTGVGSEDEASDTFAMTSKSPFSLILFGIGIFLVVAGIAYAVKLLKRSVAAKAALEATDAGLKSAVDKVRNAMADSTDKAELDTLRKQENEIVRERERLGTVGLTGKVA